MNINEILDLFLYHLYLRNSLNLILKLWLKYTWTNYDYIVLKTETIRDAVELNTLIFLHSSHLKFSNRHCFQYNTHEYLWNLNMLIKFNYECDAHQITNIAVVYSALGVQVKNIRKISRAAVNNFGGSRVDYHYIKEYGVHYSRSKPMLFAWKVRCLYYFT
jgi:hypothetical protein